MNSLEAAEDLEAANVIEDDQSSAVPKALCISLLKCL